MMMRTLTTLLLGIAIFLGNGCTTDFDRGFEAYQSGDYEQAASFFRVSAEQGNPIAQNNLAFMYRNGVGVAQDYEEAVKYANEREQFGKAIVQMPAVYQMLKEMQSEIETESSTLTECQF